MKIRILQVGYRHDHGVLTFHSLLRLPELFEVVGLADDEDLDKARARVPQAPAYYTIEEALQLDIDAVAIECEEEKATEYALMFAQKGVHVHLDKPGSPCTADFHRLVDTLAAEGKVLQMGYMYRYNPAIREAAARVRRGELGKIFSVEAQMSVRHPKAKRQWLGKFRGGMMYFLGCHLIDLILQICGTPQDILPMNCVTGTEGVEAEDYGFAAFKYENGVSFAKTCAAEYNGFARRQLVITGSQGSIELKPLEILAGENLYTPVATTLDKDSPAAWADGAVISQTEIFNRYDVMMRAFADYIAGREENPYTYDYEKTLFDTLMKCCGQ